ncbi:MAG TPA: hypothetical protein VD713_05920, partial [Sphingomonadales bacterium]|nr:hypothetical protein [Sphingomonadales bacterium]
MRQGFFGYGLGIGLALLAGACAGRGGAGTLASNAYGDYLTAVYARGLGDQERARRSYIGLVAKEPGNARLLESAYSFFIFNGDLDYALAAARRLNALDPEHTPTGMLLALDAFRGRDFAAMEARLAQVKGFAFDTLMAPLLRGWAFAMAGQDDNSLQALAPLAKTKSFEPFYTEHRAFILDYAGRTAEAEGAYRAILGRDKRLTLQPVLALAAILQKQGEPAEAEKLLREFAAKAPGNVEIGAAITALGKGQSLDSVAGHPDRAIAAAFLRVAADLGGERAFLPAVVYARFALFL